MNIMFQRFCIATILIANATTVALLLSGCSASFDSTSIPDQPVEHWEIDGKWCNTYSPQTCLTITHDENEPFGRYLLQVGLCYERGTVTGGLEFDPATDSRVCLPGFTHDLWSASETSYNGASIYLYDISQCQDTVCDENTTVYANDLDLYYVGRP